MLAQSADLIGLSALKSKALILAKAVALTIALQTMTARGGDLPQILIQPANQTNVIFGSATFSVTVSNASEVDYQWVFNGEPIADATNADLVLAPLTLAQNGYYNVIVSNSSGAISSSKAQLTVFQTILSGGGSIYTNKAQQFLLQSTNVMAAMTESFPVYVVKSDGTLAEFALEGLNVPSGLSGVASISLAPDNGYDSVIALRDDGTIVAWGSGGPSDGPDPFSLPGLSNVTAVAAGSLDIALQSNGMVAEIGIGDVFNNNLPLTNIVAISSGWAGQQYGFLALNANGTVAGWLDEYPPTPPKLVTGVSDVIAVAGGSLALKADGTVTGWDSVPKNPLPDVTNAVAISMGDQSSFLVLRADGTVVSWAQPSASNISLTFPIAFSNAFAVAGPSALGGLAMIGDGSPVFTVQPGNQSTTNGGTVWLHARAAGVQPMSYQWQINGTNLPDATNADLTIITSPGDYGQYSALASNSVGSATSRLASVTVPYSLSSETLGQALNTTNLIWTSYNQNNVIQSAPGWFAEAGTTHDGVAAAQSGAITNSMESVLSTTVAGPGTLTFWWMASSEEYFDTLAFYTNAMAAQPVASISGETGWQQETFSIASGAHTLLWVYSKDPDLSVGLDAGLLDQVNFTPDVKAQLGAPTLSSNGTLSFGIYQPNGSVLKLTDPAAITFQVSTNLTDWWTLTNALTLTNGQAILSDPVGTNSQARFYRVRTQ